MALPSPGVPISMDMIRAELGVPSQAPFNINDARLGTYAILNPYSPSLPPAAGTVSLGDWYNYCHTCTTLYTYTIYKSQNHYPQNWTTAAAACAGTRDYPLTVVSSSPTLTVGSTLFVLSGTSYAYFSVAGTPEDDIWVYDGTGGKPIRMSASDSNVVAEIGSCAPVYDTFTARYDFNSSTVCLVGTNTVYTSGGWGIGIIVYTDSGLTTPLIGYNYIVNTATNIIYEINVSTGEIQLDTGLTC